LAHEAIDLSPITLPLVEIRVTKIELDKETLIKGRSKLFKGGCDIELVFLLLHAR